MFIFTGSLKKKKKKGNVIGVRQNEEEEYVVGAK